MSATDDREQVLAFAAEHGAQAAAERFGVPAGTVRSWRARGRKVEDRRDREPDPGRAEAGELPDVEALLRRNDHTTHTPQGAAHDFVPVAAKLLDADFTAYPSGPHGPTVDVPVSAARQLTPGGMFVLARGRVAEALRRGEPASPMAYEVLRVVKTEQDIEPELDVYGLPDPDWAARWRSARGYPPPAAGRAVVHGAHVRGFEIGKTEPVVRLVGSQAA